MKIEFELSVGILLTDIYPYDLLNLLVSLVQFYYCLPINSNAAKPGQNLDPENADAEVQSFLE